jgi:hypothetical protein
LGNLSFETVAHAQQDDGCKVAPASESGLDSAAAMLGLEAAALETALTVKTLTEIAVHIVSRRL